MGTYLPRIAIGERMSYTVITTDRGHQTAVVAASEIDVLSIAKAARARPGGKPSPSSPRQGDAYRSPSWRRLARGPRAAALAMADDGDVRSSGDELSYADQRLLACQMLADELKRSLERGDHEPLIIHFRERYARLEREIETWRWYRSSVLKRRKDHVEE